MAIDEDNITCPVKFDSVTSFSEKDKARPLHNFHLFSWTKWTRAIYVCDLIIIVGN